MDFEKSKKLLIRIGIIYWALALLIYCVGYKEFHETLVSTETLSANGVVGEIVDGSELRQRYVVQVEELNELSVLFATYNRQNTGHLTFTIKNDNLQAIASKQLDIRDLADGRLTYIPLDNKTKVNKGDVLYLSITSEGCNSGNAVSVYSGNVISVGKTSVAQNIPEEDLYTFNGTQGNGKLCIGIIGTEHTNAYVYFIVAVSAAFAIVSVVCTILWRDLKKGKNNVLATFCIMFTKYGFLIKQLVSRDFKTKYKRSVLGMAWSFLNPLLTMTVQYIVFSTLFKSDIPNYPVYLLSGIVFMNFFNEAVSMGMTSITSNASLIKKVYIPKYVYPISRVISSLVNFGLAIIPLFLVMIFTGTKFSLSLLLLPFDIVCLVGFIAGMSLLLTTAMTFFQDTQFLWSVVSLMWMYLTPVFYPETIIPLKLRTLFHMNPMYQYVNFARVCIINGNSPDPRSYLWCALSSAFVLLTGIYVFRKNQDKFIMYL